MLSACSSKSRRADPTPQQTAVDAVPPGAGSWKGKALELPKDSPVVMVARLDQLLSGARRLKEWLVAEPSMFGDDGEQSVREMQLYYQLIVGYFGTDPLEEVSWRQQGLDPSQPLYVGFYAPGEDGVAFVEQVENTLREELGLAPRDDLLSSLWAIQDEGLEVPSGLNATVLRSVEGLRPISGLRVVLPASDPPAVIRMFDRLAESEEYRRFSPEEGQAIGVKPMERAYHSPGLNRPAVAVRLRPTHVLVDVVFPAHLTQTQTSPDPDARQQALIEDLSRALETVPSGRPAAPRPPNDPALGIAADHDGAALFTKIHGYRSLLASMQMTATDKRDLMLIDELASTIGNAEPWLVTADALTGTSYGLEIGSKDQVASVSMALFARRSMPELDVAPAPFTLSPEDRAAGVSATPQPLYDEAWQHWLRVEDFRRLDQSPGGATGSALIGLAGPRVMALLAANLQQLDAAEHPPTIGPLLEVAPQLARIEAVSTTPNLRDFVTNPRFMTLFVFHEDVAPEARDVAAARLRDFVLAGIAELQQQPAEVGGDTAPLVPGELTALPPVGLTSVQYLYRPQDGVLFFAVGLDAAQARQEVADLETDAPREDALTLRVEPVALVSMLTATDPTSFEPLDVNILAQRLGPMSFDVRPRQLEGARVLEYRFALEAPPKL